jgi:hypothetical protein
MQGTIATQIVSVALASSFQESLLKAVVDVDRF